MKNTLALLVISLLFFSCSGEPHQTKTVTENGYTYEYVTRDPTQTRIYTLDNGMKVYLSRYEDAPRIQFNLAVKAGGKNDPANNTGLAHYLEHMMFKGNHAFGSIDYSKEKEYLDLIEEQFETYATLTDSLERKALYREIDSVSNLAAKLAIPNEYDKMITALGGNGLNAYTTEDRTVYTVDVPSNALEKFLTLEGVRFQKIVNRLFHTELETVYEEKNRSLDNDYWKLFDEMYEKTFEKHPYGSQTVIGTVEHLKNPSIKAIKAYFNQYYRPNNVAICMSGELDYDNTIAWIDEHFGNWEPNRELEPWNKVVEDPITTPRAGEVWGPDQEEIMLGFRFDGTMSDDFLKVTMIDMLLNNSTAGLIDLNLVQQQKVLTAGCFVNDMNDYSIHTFYGTAKADQTLEQVKDLILEEIEKIKAGDFEEWMLEAVVNDLKKNEMEQGESQYANYFRVRKMVLAFTNSVPWQKYVNYYDALSAVTKEDLVAFAKENYQDNYVVVYKREGKDPNLKKVEKPEITKVALNRDEVSPFHKNLLEKEMEKLEPKFLDFSKDIDLYKIDNIEVIAKENTSSDLFRLNYVFEFGNNADPKIGFAVGAFMNYIGADSLSPEALKKEFYKLGAKMSVRMSQKGDRMYITLSGLSEKMEPTLQLFERVLQNPTATQEVLDKRVDRLKESRIESKKNKGNILFNGLQAYAKYGPMNPSNHLVTNAELDDLAVEQMTDIIQSITQYPHRITYYGNKSKEELSRLIKKHHKVPETFRPIPEVKTFKELDYPAPQVFWTHYDMVQTEIILLSKSELLDNSKTAAIKMFNEYFGGGMNSIVFQEIRESQGLAYAVFSRLNQANKATDSDYLFSYVGIQSDKQVEALASMFELLNNMPESETAFDIAKEAILNNIESERITKRAVISEYIRAQDKGLDQDIRKKVYEEVKQMSFEHVKRFYEAFVKDKPQNILLVGHRDKIDLENLSQYGKVTEISVDDLFIK